MIWAEASVGSAPTYIGGAPKLMPYSDIEPGCLVLVDRDCVGTVITDQQDGWVDVRIQNGRRVTRHVAVISRVVIER
jgi:hypothetical protein